MNTYMIYNEVVYVLNEYISFNVCVILEYAMHQKVF